MAKTTAMASGVKRNLAVPVRSRTDTNTMQMESVETNAGTAICCAPSRIARVIGASPMLRCTFSISTVASSTRMPTASARPPSVITLMVLPVMPRTIREVRMESGMEVQTISVLRQLPRNRRIMRAVSAAAMAPRAALPGWRRGRRGIDRKVVSPGATRAARPGRAATGSSPR